MSKRLLPPDWRVFKDNGDVATDATLAFRLGGTSTPTAIWYDKDLTQPSAAGVSSITCDIYGYPAASGNEVAVWGADDVTYDVVVSATGYNGGSSRTLEDIAVAASSTTDETSSELVFGNAIANGGFDSWSGGTSFSNISGDGDGDEVADGWFFTQPAAASNALSQQAGFAVGAAPVEQRYALRFGRPGSSTSTNELRLWQILAPEIAHRLRGKSVTLRFSAVAGDDFSGSGSALNIRLATGTTESEDGDLIDSGGFAGQQNVIDQAQAISATAMRFEYTVTLASNIKEIGLQFSYTGDGTAGAADYVTIQDVSLTEETASEEFPAVPAAMEFLRTKSSTLATSAGVTAAIAALSADLASTDNGEGASLIGLEDAAGDLAADNVEDAFAELFGLIDALGTPVQLKGTWDASGGSFPGSGSAQAGWSYIVSVGGTVDSVAFTAGDRIIAITNSASTSTYAANWFKADYTDQVLSVAGKTGAVTLDSGDVANVLAVGVVEVWIPASAMTSRTTNGAAAGSAESSTNKVMQITKDFDATTQEFAQFTWFPPKSWNLGTVTFVPVCIPAGSSGGWVFGLAGVAISNDDAIDAAFGTPQTSTDSFIAATDIHVGPESAAITIAGTPAAGDFVVFQINRTVADGSDTHNGDVKLLGIKLRYTINAANDT